MGEFGNTQDSVKGRKRSVFRKQKYGIPSPYKAIREKCIDCMAGQVNLVRECHIEDCSLWPYRMGRSPRAEDLQVPELDFYGKIIGNHEYPGYKHKVYSQEKEVA